MISTQFWVYGLMDLKISQPISIWCPILSKDRPGARFSKLPVITGPIKLFCFPFQMGVSKDSKIVQ